MSKSNVFAILLALLVLAEPEAAFAQTYDERTSDQVLETYAECIAAKKSGKSIQIAKYLRVPVGSELPRHIIAQLVTAKCLKGAGQMTMAPELFGRSLYAALYRRDFRKEPTEFARAVSYDAEFDAEFIPISDNQVHLREVGDCAASHNLSAAHRYVVARVWSAEEEAVLPEVVAALSKCFRDGEKIAFSHSMLKGILAESLYKYRRGMTQTEVPSA